MPPSDPSPSESPSQPGPDRDLSDVRIDSPHSCPWEANAEAHSHLIAGKVASCLPQPQSLPLRTGEATAVAQQVRTQAVQLADHLAARQVELDRREAELNARSAEFEANLERARRWLAERESDLEQLRQRWIEDRQKAKAELDAARQQLDQEQRRDWAEIREKRRSLEQRAEQLDHAAAAIRQVHEEIARVHRETLQMRLANEELVTRVASSAPADVHQRALKEIRLKLSEEFRRASDELTRRRQQLLAVRRDLSEQHRRMTQERDRLHRLAAQVAARGKR